jgi:putative sterol carrier protein
MTSKRLDKIMRLSHKCKELDGVDVHLEMRDGAWLVVGHGETRALMGISCPGCETRLP